MTRKRTGYAKGAEGFSLMEVMVTMVVLAIGLSAVYSFFLSGLVSVRTTQTHGEALRSGQLALDRFSRDFRQAQSPGTDSSTPTPLPVTAVQSLSATSVSFYVDTNRSDAATFTPKTIRYSIDVAGKKVTREEAPVLTRAPVTVGAWGPAVTVISGINPGSTFTANGVVADASLATEGPTLSLPLSATDRALVASVGVTLKLSQMTGYSQTQTEVATNVLLRNRLLQ